MIYHQIGDKFGADADKQWKNFIEWVFVIENEWEWVGGDVFWSQSPADSDGIAGKVTSTWLQFSEWKSTSTQLQNDSKPSSEGK